MRKGHAGEDVRRSLKLGATLAAVVMPLQIVAGDMHGLNTHEHQPAKIAAMEEEMIAMRTKAEEMPQVQQEDHSNEEDDEGNVIIVPAAKAKSRPGAAPVAAAAIVAKPRRTARQQWNDILEDFVAKGMKRPEAAKRMAREYSDLREAVVEEAKQ